MEAQRGKTVRFSDIILSPPKSGHGAISRFQTATQFVFILTAVLNFREVVGDPPELLVGEVPDVHEDGDGGQAVGVRRGLREVLVEVGVVPEDLDLEIEKSTL